MLIICFGLTIYNKIYTKNRIYNYAMSNRFKLIPDNQGTIFFKSALKKRGFICSNKKSNKKIDLYLVTKYNLQDLKYVKYNMCNHINFFKNTIYNKKCLLNIVNKHKVLQKYFPKSFMIKEGWKNKINTHKLYIIKPENSSSGWGIEVMYGYQLLQKKDFIVYYKDTNIIDTKSQFIIQEYIDNPLLLNGYKFDFRLYFLYTHDNKIYLYDDFLIRRTSIKYTNNNLNKNIHITNVTNNPNNTRLNNHEFYKLLNKEYPNNKLNLLDDVKKVLLILFDKIKIENNSNYQLCGFDVMLDNNFNLFFIEFNLFPSFAVTHNKINILRENLLDDIMRLTVDKSFPNNYRTNRSNKFRLIKN